MHAKHVHILSICLLVFILLPFSANSQFHDANWLEQGLLAEFRGDYEQALKIWMDAKEELEEPDSRIGLEYIRVAAEHQMDEYYEMATEMYRWAISAPFLGVNRSAVRQEIERLRPVVGDGVYRQWLNWLEERNEQLATDIKGFWIQMDPTPGTNVNERLIEHWHRIAYSRANFVKNSNTVYGTDDRALIYVRYGESDRQRSGVFTIDNQNIGRWIARHFDTADRSPETDSEDMDTRFPVTFEEDADDRFLELEEYIFQFHEQPEFEIWMYDDLSENIDQPLIFIFGTDVRTGRYKKQASIDDFIPERAYLSDRRNQRVRTNFVREGLTPALTLQMLYYEQLLETDNYFDDRLNHIRESFIDQGELAYRGLDLALRSQNREMLEMRTADAPREVSILEKMLPGISVEVHQYRLLNEDNQPVLISFLESKPVEAIRQDMELNLPDDVPLDVEALDQDELLDQGGDYLNHYLLDHKLLIYDQNWDERHRFEDSPIIRFESEYGETVIQSVFTSDHDRSNHQSAAAKLVNQDPDSQSMYPSIFPDNLRGLGTLKNRQPPPLIPEEDELMMGDLILGFRDEIPEDYPFEFRVANDQLIPGDQSLILHFEVYNLEPRPETGFTHFELTYRIFPVDEEGDLLTDEEAFYLTISYEDDQTRVIEDLEIQTTQLSSGLYELQVMIEDIQSGQQQERDIRFEVIN